MSKWLSVFGRDFYGNVDPCIENLYGVCLDGVDDYIINSGGTLGPDSSQTTKQWVSIWVKNMSTAASTTPVSIFSQSRSGYVDYDWWRITYRTQTSTGSASNQIECEWRANTINNRMREFYRLWSGGNGAKTGATSSSDYWLDGNTNINTTTDGFVHILWIIDVPTAGTPMGSGGMDLFWNGQQLAVTNAQNYAGNSQQQGPITASDITLGKDGGLNSAYFKGMQDELFIADKDIGSYVMTDFSLNTNQDIADFLYNDGCPIDVTNDNRWNFNWWRFENSWNAESGSNAFNPINGPSFGVFPNGCSFSAAVLTCTENNFIFPYWHPQPPFTSSDSASIKSHLLTNFMVPSSTWDSVVADGAMAWLAIGLTYNGNPTSTSDITVGYDYWIRMDKDDGDGNYQTPPTVSGSGSSPNVMLLEEKDPSTGALTGNSIEFQCIEDATFLAPPVASPGQQYIWKARVTSQSGFGNSTLSYNLNTPPTTTSGYTTGDFCVSWSSVTPIVTCSSCTNITATNEYRDGFQWPNSGPVGTGGGGAIGS